MLTKLKTAALSALVAVTAIAAIPASAKADNLYLGFGIGSGGYSDGYDHGWRRHHDRDWGFDDRRDFRPGCTPGRALRKADRMGINRARVQFVGRHAIGVSGRDRGHRVMVTFGRAPSCPVIGGGW